ncbi:MAG: hypothetical protein IT207_00545 [Fimbriimonadaceae bacterium]|nr:hypothetical protein [Fimbriimonadaceae bacterium]
MLATLMLGTLLLQDAPQTTTFRDKALGLSFEHPKAWRVSKERLFTLIEIPLADGKLAHVELFSATYRDTAEKWQSLQDEVNKAMGRTVERQWEEEILGVPMLLTKLAYKEGERETVTFVGLLYSATPEKMQFRLNTPADQAETAQQAWWSALLTLRTNSGLLPSGEDPSKPLTELQPEPEKPTIVLRKPDPVVTELRPGARVPFKGLVVQLLDGWTLAEDGTLRSDGTSGLFSIELFEGDGNIAGPKLEETAASALTEFKKVSLRRDERARTARSGATVASIWRAGEGDQGPLVVGHFAGVCGQRFWMLRYRGAGTAAWNSDRAKVEVLVESLYVEAAD